MSKDKYFLFSTCKSLRQAQIDDVYPNSSVCVRTDRNTK